MAFSRDFRRWKKPAIAAAVVVFLYTVGGFFAFPAIVGKLLPDKLGAALNRQVTLEKVRFNPYALSITLENLRVEDPGGVLFAGFDRFYANFQASSLFRWAAVFREVTLEGPEARIVRIEKSRFNFSDLLPEASESAVPTKEDGDSTIRFAVEKTSVRGGRIAFEDRYVDSRHRVEGLELLVENLSSLPAGAGKEASVKLMAAVDGAPVSIGATAQPFAPEPSFSAAVSIEKLNVPPYLVYLPEKPAAVIESATLGLSLQVGFQMQKSGGSVLSLSGPVDLSGIDIVDRKKRPLLKVPQLTVKLAESNLLASELVVEEIRVDAPEVLVVRGPEGEVNLTELAPAGAKKEAETAETGGEPAISLLVKQVFVTGAKARFEDRAVAGAFTTDLAGIDAAVTGFSLAGENRTEFRLSFSTAAAETVAIDGGFSLSPLRADARFDIGDIELSRYMPYVSDLVNFEIRDGRLSINGQVRYSDGPKTPALSVETANATLRSLVLYRPEEQDQVVAVSRLEVNGAAFSTEDLRLHVKEIASQTGELSYLRHKDGRINLADLVALPEADASASEPGPPFSFAVDRVRFSDYRLRLEDRRPTETVISTISDIRIEADGLTNAAGKTAQVGLAARGERGGELDISGGLGLDPIRADLQVKVDRVDIRAFQPYFTDRVKIIVTGGTASAQGRFLIDAAGKEMPEVRYTGRVEINGFNSVDKEDTLDFIAWESLFVANLDFRMPPLALVIEEIGLTDLYSRLIIDEDGTINVTEVLSGGDEEKGGPPPPAETARTASSEAGDGETRNGEVFSGEKERIEIRKITLQNGHINFSDRFNPFNFAGDLTRIGGRVSGLSSLGNGRADVLLEGSWEDRAPMEIKGKIDPMAQERYADLTLTIRHIDLSPFSPYSGKFLGYKLEKGLLTLELGYLLEGSYLKGDNRAYFEELTLGDRVKSADAVTLPVAMAVSLLKGPDGSITLDVPVEGDLNDPQFSLGRTVLRVLGNLMAKIVSAPFAWLGNLVGAKEELSYVDFAPGSAQISPEAGEKIDALIIAMGKRPAVKLNIRGNADPEADPEALRRKKFENLLRSAKLKEMTARGETAVPIDQVEISPEEYPRYLKKAYDAAPFTKPRDAEGNIKALAAEEMEKLLLTQFVLTEHDLRQLAVNRADAVKARLLEGDQVGPGRLFIVEPVIGGGSDDPEKAGKSQVRFSLR